MPTETTLLPPIALQGAVVLVTGANRGLGRDLVTAALAAGAGRVYAAARDPSSVDTGGNARVIALALDVTDVASVAEAARIAGDTTVLINNAGISRGAGVLDDGDPFTAARAELETNFFGPWAMARAFAPVLAANGGGAILNVLSALTWIGFPTIAGYCASKSAAWSLTNSLRQALKGQGTRVAGLHVGYMDTDMARGADGPKASPRDVARQAFEDLARGRGEILADAVSVQLKNSLSAASAPYL